MFARAGEVPSVRQSAESGLTARQGGYFFDNSQRIAVIRRSAHARWRGLTAEAQRTRREEGMKARRQARSIKPRPPVAGKQEGVRGRGLQRGMHAELGGTLPVPFSDRFPTPRLLEQP